MKKQIYKFKVGDKVKVMNALIDMNLIGKVLPIVKIKGASIWLKGSRSFWTKSEGYIKLVTPKKVTNPSKKVKQECYKIEFIKRENGWTLTAWGSVTQYLVFNTKFRMLKWIANNI